eukprot:GHVT01012578.1.p1 GENE.GHVT01012578.1~~GHVT01012578.1.p1  ORF type:complete len:511 (-),score=30.07 GHVT01012578.1:522-2054(-)
MMHLTNYSINRASRSFEQNSKPHDATCGHKRSLRHVFERLQGLGYDMEAVQAEIDEIAVRTISAVVPNISHVYTACQPDDLSDSMCFEVLGFDILLDHKAKPWLIEVNHSPSFATDSKLDEMVKSQVIRDALLLVNTPGDRRRAQQQRQTRIASRMRDRGKPPLDRHERQIERRRQAEKIAASRSAWEDGHLGGYRRLYPTKDRMEQCEMFFQAANEMWESLTGSKKKGTAPYKGKTYEDGLKASSTRKSSAAAGTQVNRTESTASTRTHSAPATRRKKAAIRTGNNILPAKLEHSLKRVAIGRSGTVSRMSTADTERLSLAEEIGENTGYIEASCVQAKKLIPAGSDTKACPHDFTRQASQMAIFSGCEAQEGRDCCQAPVQVLERRVEYMGNKTAQRSGSLSNVANGVQTFHVSPLKGIRYTKERPNSTHNTSLKTFDKMTLVGKFGKPIPAPWGRHIRTPNPSRGQKFHTPHAGLRIDGRRADQISGQTDATVISIGEDGAFISVRL